VKALQCIFSRYLILEYPQEKSGFVENQHGAGKGKKLLKEVCRLKNFSCLPPSPRARRQEVRSGEVIVVGREI